MPVADEAIVVLMTAANGEEAARLADLLVEECPQPLFLVGKLHGRFRIPPAFACGPLAHRGR